MDLTHPHRTITSALQGDVLVALARAGRPLSGREVARWAGGSHAGVDRVLARFVEAGLVDRADHPPVALYSLNREHVAAPIAEAMAALSSMLLDRIRGAVERWDPPALTVTLFGSAARGEGGSGSDVDLLIVRPTEVDGDDPRWDRQVAELSARVRRWSGNPCRVVEYDLEDVRRAVAERLPLLDAVLDEGVNLGGSALRDLVRPVRLAG